MKKTGILLIGFLFPVLLHAQLQGEKKNQLDQNDKKTGYWEEKAGNLTLTGNYADGLKTGNWITFQPNHIIYRLESYSEGKKNGISLQFNRKAKLINLDNYANDKLNGLSITYHDYNETKLQEANYLNGKLEGLFRTFYDNGKIKEESFFKENVKHGPSKWFSQSGRLIAIYTYAGGQFYGVQRTFYENDTLQTISNYLDNKLHGEYQEFYRNGKLKVSGTYVNGLKEGNWTDYSETGKPVRTRKYKQDVEK